MPTNITNLSGQLGALADFLPESYAKHWKAGYGDLTAELGRELESLVEEQFSLGVDPNGKPWTAYSALTKKVYAKTGNTLKLGGTALRRSFQIGSRGNVWKVTSQGFTYGSDLTVNSKSGETVSVASAFQERYVIPRPAGAKKRSRPKAKKRRGVTKPKKRSSQTPRTRTLPDQEKARQRRLAAAVKAAQREDDARRRVQRFMGWATGINAPGRGRFLTHPAREILFWTDDYTFLLNQIVQQHMAKAIDKAYAETERQVNRQKQAATTIEGGQAYINARAR